MKYIVIFRAGDSKTSTDCLETQSQYMYFMTLNGDTSFILYETHV